jgi:uncharacterized protein
MFMKFVGRDQELHVLETAYRSKNSGFIPIYGRRRVGKSELILHFLGTKKALYFVGKKAPASLQIKEFLQEASIAVGEPLLAKLELSSWKEALELLVSHWPKSKKIILALDEFQWMAEASPELPSILQELWDRQWSKSGRVLLILCGSFIGFMEREVLGKKAPLFGRRTAQILLRPFGFQQAALFHPHYSLTDKARAYFICGGVPFYLKCFSDMQSIEQNIQNNLLNEFAALSREPDFLLREELREVDNYYAILMALAAGFNTGKAITEFSKLPEKSLFYYLQQLLGLGYLGKRVFLDGSKKAARQVSYTLEDPLLLFWFRFVFPHVSSILHLGQQQALAQHIKPHLDSYFGSCFERLCREALALKYRDENVLAAFQIGAYWNKQVQIDIVGVREDGVLDIGECKWGSVTSWPNLQQEIKRKAQTHPNARNFTVREHVFVRQKSKKVLKTTLLVHDLKDMYGWLGD